jgi:hypothetical protein
MVKYFANKLDFSAGSRTICVINNKTFYRIFGIFALFRGGFSEAFCKHEKQMPPIDFRVFN